MGQAASMGSLLLAAGEPGMRHSLPNSRIMIHQPSGGAQVNISKYLIRIWLNLLIRFIRRAGSSHRHTDPS